MVVLEEAIYLSGGSKAREAGDGVMRVRAKEEPVPWGLVAGLGVWVFSLSERRSHGGSCFFKVVSTPNLGLKFTTQRLRIVPGDHMLYQLSQPGSLHLGSYTEE